MKLKRNDLVVVLSGNFQGIGPARLLSIDRHEMTCVIEGVGNVLKHVKRGHPKSPQGGRVTIPTSIRLSKIALHCSACQRGVRVKSLFEDGKKSRACVRCNKSL